MENTRLLNKSFANIFILVFLLAGIILFVVNWLVNIPVKEKLERERIEQVKRLTGIDESAFSYLPLILGKREGCIVCHSSVKGIESSHNPENIGCYSCHLGNRLTKDKTEAHKGIVLIPGNSSNASKTCGSIGCHPQMIPRMQNSIMNTMNGVVSVDKWVFGEAASPTFRSPIDSISYSPADLHLRNLCASCHLSNEKNSWGPINELSRGGGCLACHLNYSQTATEGLHNYLSSKKENFTHPQISLKVTDDHCFGCHSRSGRISLSYEGWNETLYKPEEIKGKSGFRILDDGRVVTKIQADIHSGKGMLCTDCHTSYEIMGDGSYYLHKEDQVKVQCTDCHLILTPATTSYNSLDFESDKIALLKGFIFSNNYLLVKKNQFPLVNCYLQNGKVYLVKQFSGQNAEMKPPSTICTARAHKSLSCMSCHSGWSPQCIGCHTEYDKNSSMYDLLSNKEIKGEWREYPKDFLAEPAVLGIREIKEAGSVNRTVEEFIPGMILTITNGGGSLFKRLYAPSFSHTIRKESRTCVSCHNNPLALGYGRGNLEYKISGKSGRWVFTPVSAKVLTDGLPEDAWIGFLKERRRGSATRENLRPFSVEEQKRILLVGTCLTCHSAKSAVIKESLLDFDTVLAKRTKSCIIPDWKY
jgi:hypothetical protein